MALIMKPACERCGGEVAPHAEAYICAYECTFCAGCAGALRATCPNGGGELVRRPRPKAAPAAGRDAASD